MAQKAKKNIENSLNLENTDVDNDKDLIIESLKKDNEKLKQENDDKNKKVEELSKGFSELQEKLNFLLNSKQFTNTNSTNSSEDVKVGFRGVYGGVLSTNDGSLQYKFESNETKYIDSEDLKLLFRETGLRNNKKLFEEDIFYFEDEKYYSTFKIKKKIDLSKENILRILTKPNVNDTIIELNKMTNNKIDFRIMHTFQFQVARLLIDNDSQLKNWDYSNRITLEKYLNQKFDDLLASLGAIELLGRTKFRN